MRLPGVNLKLHQYLFIKFIIISSLSRTPKNMSSQNSVRSSFGFFLVRKKRLKNFPCWDSCFWFSTLHINLECKALSIPTYHENGQVKDWNGNWVQHTMVDLGFPRGGGVRQPIIWHFFAKTAWKWKISARPWCPLGSATGIYLHKVNCFWYYQLTCWHSIQVLFQNRSQPKWRSIRLCSHRSNVKTMFTCNSCDCSFKNGSMATSGSVWSRQEFYMLLKFGCKQKR